MLEQVRVAFPEARVTQVAPDTVSVDFGNNCIAYISNAQGMVCTGYISNYWGKDVATLGNTPADVCERLRVGLRRELDRLSSTTRKALRAAEVPERPAPTVPPPDGFPWVLCGKNRWSAAVAHDTIYLRYSKSYGYFEYHTDSGFEGRVRPHESLVGVLTTRLAASIEDQRGTIKHRTKNVERLVAFKQSLEALCSTK